MSPSLVCRRCQAPVEGEEMQHYDVFEQMHYACFHYEFEHDIGGQGVAEADDCGLAGCPSAPPGQPLPRTEGA